MRRSLSAKGRLVAHISPYVSTDIEIRTLLDIVEHPLFIDALSCHDERILLFMIRPFLVKPESELFLAIASNSFLVAARAYLRDVRSGRAIIHPLNRVH